jgi:murein DD-endopeptidase
VRCALLVTTAAFAQALTEASVEVRIPLAPTPVKGGQTLLVYELHLTNFQSREVTLNRVEAFDQSASGAPLVSYEERTLIDAIDQPAAESTAADKRRIGGGARAVVYMWLTFEKPEAVPRRLRHKLSFTYTDTDGKTETLGLDISSLEVSQTAPTVIPPPVKGGMWIAGNGPSNRSVHRRALRVAGGQARISQRFAIDWAKLCDDGNAWHGDSKVKANWCGYGTEVLAVSDAVVSSAKDGIPENVPLSPTRAVPITRETAGGNYVILALGDGQFALDAHLQPGSLQVKPGDRVRRGQVLGLLGNSGNTDAPHLHFHLSDENSWFGAEGLPFVFDSFEVLGTADVVKAILEGWTMPAGVKPEKRLRELPLENAVVRFD